MSRSSSTCSCFTGETVGPPLVWLPLTTTVYPVPPPSDDPMASVTTRLGKVSRYWSFSAEENSAAVEDRANNEVMSYDGPLVRYSSISGRAMASPVIMIRLIFSSAMVRQASAASNFERKTTFEPMKLPDITLHWLAPCISGAVG